MIQNLNIKNLIFIRKEKKISQTALAEKCGMPQSTIGRIEAGKVAPNIQTLQKMAEVLGIEFQIIEKDNRPEYIKRWDGLEFTCYWKDEPISEVHVKNTSVHIKRFSTHPMKQIFAQSNMDVFRLSEILETRCWQRESQNIDNYLKKLDLNYYDPLSIVRKTHGVSYNDFLWFQFKGEDLEWSKVAPKRFRNV